MDMNFRKAAETACQVGRTLRVSRGSPGTARPTLGGSPGTARPTLGTLDRITKGAG